MLDVDDTCLVQLMTESYQLAAQSIDPSTQNAALIVDKFGTIITSGCNHPVSGVQARDWSNYRDEKLRLFEHAERSAIYQAAKTGKALEGLFMVCSWAACQDCAKAIIETGLKGLIVHQPRMELDPGDWQRSIQTADKMLIDAGVVLVKLPSSMIAAPVIRHRGKRWNPNTLTYQSDQ